METMKGALTDGKGNIWIQDVPMPVMGDYECLCRIEACATCTGTDMMTVTGRIAWAQEDRFPALFGHESVGKVVAVGKKVRNIKTGDRYLRPAAWYPGEYRNGIFSMMAGYAQYGIVTDREALLQDDPEAKISAYTKFQQPLPDHTLLSSVDASMLVTMKELYSYIAGLGIRQGHTVAITGAGVVAMNMCFFAKLAGAKVIVAARREEALARCYQAGADILIDITKEDMASALKKAAPGGVDFILDGAGVSELLIKASAALKDEGAICSYASGLDKGDLMEKLEVPGYWRFVRQGPREDRVHEHFLSLVRMNILPYSLFYSHVMPLESIAEGFELIKNKKAHKIVFTMEQK